MKWNPGKKFRPEWDSNPWTLRYRCIALPAELSSHLGVDVSSATVDVSSVSLRAAQANWIMNLMSLNVISTTLAQLNTNLRRPIQQMNYQIFRWNLVQTCIALAFMSDEPRTWNILLPSWSYVSSSEPARYPAPLPPYEIKFIALKYTDNCKQSVKVHGDKDAIWMYRDWNVLKLLMIDRAVASQYEAGNRGTCFSHFCRFCRCFQFGEVK